MFHEYHRKGAQALWSPPTGGVDLSTPGFKTSIPVCEPMILQVVGLTATTTHSGGGPLKVRFDRRPTMSSGVGVSTLGYVKAPAPLAIGTVLRRILPFPIVLDPGDELVVECETAVTSGGGWPFWLVTRPNFPLDAPHADIVESVD